MIAAGLEILQRFRHRRLLQPSLAKLAVAALSALSIVVGTRDVMPADSTSGDRVVFYQYTLPVDPSVSSWRLETDRGREHPSLALHLEGRDASGRLRGDFSIARGVVASSAAEALHSSRETPSSVDLAYDVLKDQEVGEQSRVTVAVQGRRQEKMVKDVEGSATVNLVLALFPSLESSASPSPWSAKVGVGLARIRQLMARGTGGSAEREVATTLPTVGAQWSQQWLTFDYRFAFRDGDRVGGERSDASTLQTLLASFQPDPRFTLRAGLAQGQLAPRDFTSRYASLGFDWRLRPGVSIGGGCDLGIDSGTPTSTKRGCGIQGGLAKTLDLLGPLRLPIDLYAAPSLVTTKARSRSTEIAANDWMIDVGLNFRF